MNYEPTETHSGCSENSTRTNERLLTGEEGAGHKQDNSIHVKVGGFLPMSSFNPHKDQNRGLQEEELAKITSLYSSREHFDSEDLIRIFAIMGGQSFVLVLCTELH